MSVQEMSGVPTDMRVDLGEYFPALRKYCPLLDSLSPQQALFLLLDCREAFYGGAAGGGKSAALLMAALQYADVPGYAALILRKSFPQLSQPGMLIPMSRTWLGRTDARWNEQMKEWRFPSGATLRFGHVQDEGAIYDYQGGAYHFVGFDELTQFSEHAFTYIAFSRQRRDLAMRDLGIPIRVRATANPGGIGHGWVKKRYIDAREKGVEYIPARVSDNPGLDVVEYEESLMHLPEMLRKQLLDGDWGAFEGAAFPEFDKEIHCVRDTELGKHWDRFESMDYGLNNPTCWLAWAVDTDGNLVVFDSYYKPALPSESAPVVLLRRHDWRSTVCYGDPQSLAQRTGTVNRFGDPATIETEFADQGVPLVRANNNPRSGYTRVRELIKPDPERRFPDWHPKRGEGGAPRLFVDERHCPQLVEQLATATLQPIDKRWGGEMVDPDWEGPYGHAIAALRYGALSRPGPSDTPVVEPEDPRAQLLKKYEDARDVDDNEPASRYSW
jgi:hypothetical protein